MLCFKSDACRPFRQRHKSYRCSNINLIIERSNTMAAFVSASSVPVSSVGLAGVGLILKHFKVIDLGYETASNKTQ